MVKTLPSIAWGRGFLWPKQKTEAIKTFKMVHIKKQILEEKKEKKCSLSPCWLQNNQLFGFWPHTGIWKLYAGWLMAEMGWGEPQFFLLIPPPGTSCPGLGSQGKSHTPLPSWWSSLPPRCQWGALPAPNVAKSSSNTPAKGHMPIWL